MINAQINISSQDYFLSRLGVGESKLCTDSDNLFTDDFCSFDNPLANLTLMLSSHKVVVNSNSDLNPASYFT